MYGGRSPRYGIGVYAHGTTTLTLTDVATNQTGSYGVRIYDINTAHLVRIRAEAAGAMGVSLYKCVSCFVDATYAEATAGGMEIVGGSNFTKVSGGLLFVANPATQNSLYVDTSFYTVVEAIYGSGNLTITANALAFIGKTLFTTASISNSSPSATLMNGGSINMGAGTMSGGASSLDTASTGSITSTAAASQTITATSGYVSIAAGGDFLANASSSLRLRQGGNDRLVLADKVYPKTSILGVDGSWGSPTYTFDNEPDLGFYRISSGLIANPKNFIGYGTIDTVSGFKANGVAGFSGTKTAGACVFTISLGIITNVSGC